MSCTFMMGGRPRCSKINLAETSAFLLRSLSSGLIAKTSRAQFKTGTGTLAVAEFGWKTLRSPGASACFEASCILFELSR